MFMDLILKETADIEVWTPIKELDNFYEVSNLGRIASKKFNRTLVLSASINTNGYYQLRIRHNGKHLNFTVHKLVGITLVANPYKLTDLNHKDGNKLNNNVNNLEWTNTRENASHGYSRKNKSSKYVGVTWHKQRNNWKASIYINKKAIHLGSFKVEEDARDAYIEALEVYGLNNKYAS